MAASEQTMVKIGDIQTRYQRLISMGAEKMAPATMADFAQQISDMQTAVSLPDDPSSIGPDVAIEAAHANLVPLMERLQDRIQAALSSPPAVPLISVPPSTPAVSSFQKMTPWLILGGIAALGYFMFGRETSQNPGRKCKKMRSK